MTRHFLILVWLSSTSALPAKDGFLSLAEIPQRTISHNPELAAARWRIEEAKGFVLGSGRRSNPELGIEVKSDPDFREGAVVLSFDQKFPLTSRLKLEKSLSLRLVEAAELEVAERERQVIAENQSITVQLIALQKKMELGQLQLQLTTKLSEFARTRSASGEISPLDAAQAQVDSQRLILENRQQETEYVLLLSQLKPKLGIKESDTLTIENVWPSADLPKERSWSGRPDYQLAKLHEEVAQQSIELAKSRKWEDIQVGAFVEGERMNETSNGLENTGFIGLRISLPLPLWNKNEGEIVEKNASSHRAAAVTTALAANITHEVSSARSEMEAHLNLAAETRDKLLPLVREQTERLEKAYESGHTDLLTVLRAREQRLQLETAVLDATRNFHLARIRFEAATSKYRPISTK